MNTNVKVKKDFDDLMKIFAISENFPKKKEIKIDKFEDDLDIPNESDYSINHSNILDISKNKSFKYQQVFP